MKNLQQDMAPSRANLKTWLHWRWQSPSQQESMERFPSAEMYLTLGIQICPLKGISPIIL